MSQAALTSEQAVNARMVENNESLFDLGAITSSFGFAPQKVIVYGVPGVGKTTFASTWPKPILLRTEDGAGALNIPTFPKVCTTFREITWALRSLYETPHDYKTLVVDSLDWAEPVVWQEVCFNEGKQSIEDFGFGKGYVKVDDKWRLLQRQLDYLRRERGMHIVCIAHAVAQVFDPPDSDSYMRYSLKLHKRAAAIWTEWAEQMLFVNYNVQLVGSKGEMQKAKATGNGERIIYTQERPAYQAKSRWPLPDSIFIGNDAKWAAYHEALKTASNGGYDHE